MWQFQTHAPQHMHRNSTFMTNYVSSSITYTISTVGS